MSKKHASDKQVHAEKDEEDGFHVNKLILPDYVAHMKPGNTLCTNDETFIVQDGSTTIEIRMPPKFEPKKIPWRNGLIRDIVWSSQLNVYVLLTQKGLFTFNPQSLLAAPTTTINTDIQLKITNYSKIKPFDDKHSFWRCACVGTTVFICYSGFGTVIDEYTIKSSSCDLVKRWLPPKTCAQHEGIWCIRYHPGTEQIGMSIMDGTNNQWRFETRDRKNLSTIWQTVLPLSHGDCEISPLANEEWLAVNSCGIRLVQIAHQKFRAAVEYERELRNAIAIGENYFVVRTKNTLEIHLLKKKEK